MKRLLTLALVLCAAPAAAAQVRFDVVFDEETFARVEPYTGRVFVALSEGAAEPRIAIHDWFQEAPLFALDVRGVEAGETLVFEAGRAGLVGDPVALDDLPPGRFRVQAIVRLDPDSPRAGRGALDIVSEPVAFVLAGGEAVRIELRLTRRVGKPPFEETQRIKELEIESDVLSAFHGRPLGLRASVRLPRAWHDEPERTWPVIWFVMGFGQDHRDAARMFSAGLGPGSDELLIVFPDPTCFRGHSAFYDSPTNGPYGRALVEELIPAVEEAFRASGSAQQRFVTGGSSGGWTALALQLTYPDIFAACYSHVPDPVDFRAWIDADLYDPETNVYQLEDGSPRPMIRSSGQVLVWMKEFVAREDLLGPGGQIGSLEATFSPRAEDGSPLPMFDRVTGAVQPEVVEAWRAHDLSLVLQDNWESLGPKLEGKLFVWAGEFDNFHLEGPVALLIDTLADLDSDAVVEVVPGMAHTLHTPGVQAMLERALASGRD